MSETGTGAAGNDENDIPSFLRRCRNNSPGCSRMEAHPRDACTIARGIEPSKILDPSKAAPIENALPSTKHRRAR